MEEISSKKPLIYFSSIILAAALFALFLIKKCAVDEANYDSASQQSENQDGIGVLENIAEPNIDEATPEELIGQIRAILLSANSEKNAQPLIDYVGKNHFSQSQLQQLQRLAASSGLKLDSSSPYSRVEGYANRWSMNLADKSKILIDLEKSATGKWQIKNITLPEAAEINAKLTTQQDDKSIPPPPAVDQSALITITKFLNAITKLDAVTAGNYIDDSQVSYATLAGLCIIFEEGDYSLLEDKTLRKMFLKDTSSGWLVRLRSASTGELAMFSITSKRGSIDLPWKITEINLDNLLSNYAQRVLGGDIYYSPLIKNPKGGDNLAIYFDLDAKNLTNRTKRQLSIVAKLLKVSLDKKLTITGHTDSLGSDPYNLALSKARAEKVMEFLAENGINKNQMEIVGYGKSQPRLPNTTAAGDDSPAGRRANRRAEILLDF